MQLRLDGSGPRYSQITRALAALIQSGDLAPGTRVPATRDLARDLGCSRNIVLLAYEQLTLEGYFITRTGSGTFVAPDLARAASPFRSEPAEPEDAASLLSANGRRLVDVGERGRSVTFREERLPIDFPYGLAEPDARVVARLRAAFGAALRKHPFRYGHPAGDRSLREQVAERLRGVRGILRSADEIVITGGAQQALDVCARLLLNAGERVVVEEPGYEGAHAPFLAAGARLVRVRVDDQGLNPAALHRLDRVRLVYVTPSHQFPTGAIMPVARRYALLEWARRHGTFILEDDYNGEFRHAGRSIEALAALAPGGGRVIYCGTLAKSLFPSLRLGYLALPKALVGAAVACKWITDRGCPTLLQLTVAELMATGEYDRHIRRMLRRYRARRAALIAALEFHLGDDVEIAGGSAGLHLTAWLPRLAPERVEELVARCRECGVGVYSVASHAALALRRGGLILGYGTTGVEEISRGVKALAAVYEEMNAAASVRSVPRLKGSRAVR